MFKNFVRRTLDNKVYKISYLDDFKLFEFGPIFVGNYRWLMELIHVMWVYCNVLYSVVLDNRWYFYRVYEEKYTIDLKNSSLITADVEIEFQEETPVFQIDKTFIRLKVSH